MCIMFTENTAPSGTLLVLAPLEAAEWWQLLYVNSISAPGALMIVPVPNVANLKEHDFVRVSHISAHRRYPCGTAPDLPA